MNTPWRVVVMAVLLASGSFALRPKSDASSAGDIRFEERASASGIAHRHTLCRLPDVFLNIMPWLTSVGAAAAAADVDGDGAVDLYVTTSGRGDTNRLYRNRGDGTFEDITDGSGTEVGNREGASMAAVFGDVDNDGDPDLYVVRWGAPNLLLENLGGGRFRDVTAASGTGFRGYGNGATFLDYDRDGRLDLLVANYFPETLVDPSTGKPRALDLWNPFTTRVMHESFTHARNGGRNVLYRNLGGLQFEDVTLAAGLDHTGWSLAVGAADLDNDGWPDLYVANDFGADELYFNTGATESPARFRSFVGRDDRPAIGDDWWKGMNVDFGDVDGNGFLDIYVTNILAPRYKTDEGNMLWLNLPDASAAHGRRFVNVGRKTGTHDGGWGWGAKFADFDNDGRMDILASNGFVTGPDARKTYWYELQEMVTQLKNATADAADWPVMGDRDLSGYERNRLWRQVAPEDGTIAFVEVAQAAGVRDLHNGRGVVLLDADGDGDLDVFIANQSQVASFYLNRLDPPHGGAAHWIGLDLVGDPSGFPKAGARPLASTRDAIGAQVRVTCAGVTHLREVQGGIGFAAQSDRRIFVGLGTCDAPDSIEIRWPSGRVTALAGEQARETIDRMTRVVESDPAVDVR